MDDFILTLLIILIVISPFMFLSGIITIVVCKEQKQKQIGIKLLIASVVIFLIGCGGCLMAFNSSGMH
jgi:hypothetical protein